MKSFGGNEIDMAKMDALLKVATPGSHVCVECYGVFSDGPAFEAHYKAKHPIAISMSFKAGNSKFIRITGEEEDSR